MHTNHILPAPASCDSLQPDSELVVGATDANERITAVSMDND